MIQVLLSALLPPFSTCLFLLSSLSLSLQIIFSLKRITRSHGNYQVNDDCSHLLLCLKVMCRFHAHTVWWRVRVYGISQQTKKNYKKCENLIGDRWIWHVKLQMFAVSHLSEVFNVEPAGTTWDFPAFPHYWSFWLPHIKQSTLYMFWIFSPVKPTFRLLSEILSRVSTSCADIKLFSTPVVILLHRPVAVETCHVWDGHE